MDRPANARLGRLGAPLLAAAALAAVLAPGCGGGGGPTAPPTPPPPPPPAAGISFTAAGTPGDMTIHLAQESGTAANLLRLEVRASMVTDLYGLGFDLDYPAGVLEFSGAAAEGGFLSEDGSRVELLVTEQPDGNLIVGLARLGAAEGVDGSGLLLTLDFTSVANGTGSFDFAANEAFDRRGRRIEDAEWQAGSVEVTL